MSTAIRVRVPASIGNVGPGFDVLGLAVEGLHDELTLELTAGDPAITAVTGRDAAKIPRDARRNCAAIAALSYLQAAGDTRSPSISLHRGLPSSGGLGSSAASTLAGAFAAALAMGRLRGSTIADASAAEERAILAAALDGEGAVAGRHLDNIAPALYGGLCLVVSTEPPLVHRLPLRGSWWVGLATPDFALRTKDARAVLPSELPRTEFVAQLGYVAGVVAAFASGDHALMRHSLRDAFAEPRRAPLIAGFDAARAAALAAGALGCTISGAGPTLFALAPDAATAAAAASAMQKSFGGKAQTHVGAVATSGATLL